MNRINSTQSNDEEKRLKLRMLKHRVQRLTKQNESIQADADMLVQKQLKLIESLTAENRALHEQHAEAAVKDRLTQKSYMTTTDVQQLHDTRKNLEKELLNQKEALTLLEEEEKQANAALSEIRSKIAKRGGMDTMKNLDSWLSRHTNIVESKLTQALEKYNKQSSINKNAKERIDALRKRQTALKQFMKKLKADVIEMRAERVAYLETAKRAYNARDTTHQQTLMLRARAEKENQMFESEWRELQQLLDNDLRMVEYLNQKEVSQLTNISEGSSVSTNAEKLQAEKSEALKREMDELRSNIMNYETMFTQMLTVSNVDNVTDLMDKLETSEENNFFMYNYSTKLESDIMTLEHKILELQRKAQPLKGDGDIANPKMNNQIIEIDQRVAVAEKNLEEARNNISVLCAGTLNLFRILKGDVNLMAHKQGQLTVNETNVLEYIAAVENRLRELLYIRIKEKPEEIRPYIPIKQKQPSVLRIPSIHDIQSDDENLDMCRPLLYSEVKQQVLHNIKSEI